MTASAGPPTRPATRPAATRAGGGAEGGLRRQRPRPGRRSAGAPTPPGRPRSATGARTTHGGDRYPLAVETPSDCSTLATMPVVGSKNFVLTAVHPPSLSMVKSVWGLGKLNLAATAGSTGR